MSLSRRFFDFGALIVAAPVFQPHRVVAAESTVANLRGAAPPVADVIEHAGGRQLLELNDCKDADWQCAPWAEMGECKTNPDYMSVNCPVSCGTCTTSAEPTTPEPTTPEPTTSESTTTKPTTPVSTTPVPTTPEATTQEQTTQSPTTQPTPSPSTPSPAPPRPIPGYGECQKYGFSINTCYTRYGFVDGDCLCAPGLWDGRYTWYQWVCTKKHGAPHQAYFCDQACQSCHP